MTILKPLQPPQEPKSSHGLGRGLHIEHSWAEAGGRTCCYPWCSKEGWQSWPTSPQAVGHKSTKSGAQIFTLMFLSCGNLKDLPGLPGLGAELSVRKSKSQDQFSTCKPNLFVLRISPVQAKQWRGDATVPSAKPRAEIARHVLR